MTSLRLLWRNSPVKINTLPSFFASQRENVSQRGFNSQPKYKGFFSREIDKSKKENKSENNQSVAATPVSIVDPPPVSTPVVVYNGTMDNTVYSVKHFSLFTSTLILCVQPILLYKSDSVVKSALTGGFGLIFFLTPVLIHTIAKKYVLELTLDDESKEFEATTYNLFLQKKKLKFAQTDIKIPPTPLPFTTIYAKEVPLLLLPDGWKSRYAYDKCMLLEKQTIDWSQIKSDPSKDT